MPLQLNLLGEREQRLREAYEWCLHDPLIQATYAGQVVAAERGRVWGSGPTHAAAWQAAQRAGGPDKNQLVFVAVPGIPA